MATERVQSSLSKSDELLLEFLKEKLATMDKSVETLNHNSTQMSVDIAIIKQSIQAIDHNINRVELATTANTNRLESVERKLQVQADYSEALNKLKRTIKYWLSGAVSLISLIIFILSALHVII